MVSDRGICNKYADWSIIFLVSDINHLKIGDTSTSSSSSENVPFLVHPLNISFRIRAQISALTLSIMLIPVVVFLGLICPFPMQLISGNFN